MTIHPFSRYGNIDDTIMSRESPPKRKYELKKRAEEMAGTRRRITEAAIELHGSVGPARTTLSAVAKQAGVERRTLYRHFPNEADLFEACSTHYFSANPWPDLATWRAIRDPQQRLERALDELYAYYERTEPMLSNVLRDAELVDTARDAIAPLHTYLEQAAEILTPDAKPAAEGDNSSRQHCATPSPSQPGTRSQPTASDEQTRQSSPPHSSRAQPPHSAAKASSSEVSSVSGPAGRPPPRGPSPRRVIVTAWGRGSRSSGGAWWSWPSWSFSSGSWHAAIGPTTRSSPSRCSRSRAPGAPRWSGSPQTAGGCRSNVHGRATAGTRWCRTEGLAYPSVRHHADAGLANQLAFLDEALDWVAHNTPRDRETRYLEARVTSWHNDDPPRVELLRSDVRGGAG